MPTEQFVPEWTPEALVGRIRQGDSGAEAELFRRYERGVSVVLRRAGADAGSEGDLRQETFRIALEKIRQGDVREPGRLSGFICSLARNLAIEHFRKRSARRFTEVQEDTAAAGPESDPFQRLVREEQARLVRRVLSEMGSDRDRQILFRFYLAEDEKDAICRDLGLTSLHFNRVLFRARERYGELYREAAENSSRAPR